MGPPVRDWCVGVVLGGFGSFLAADLEELYRDARSETLRTRGRYSYSNLGAAIAGQAAAAAAGMSYSALMKTRLFGPLHMNDTAIQGAHPIVTGGSAKSGIPVHPWILGAYAPAGGIVATARDLARLASALLDGTAPGMSALRSFAPTSQADTGVGIFWHTTTHPSDPTITWHGGETGGYTTYFGLDRAGGHASVVLSDVANPATDALGEYLLGSGN